MCLPVPEPPSNYAFLRLCASISTSIDSRQYSTWFSLFTRHTPDKSEWFHCTCIHTIVDERLGIFENKAMKLFSSRFVSLMLIRFVMGFCGPSYNRVTCGPKTFGLS